uniref:Uncharacterized protein n=1 Tax=Polytomella parva TaxID=51329 RepID=A0A7S0UNN4_9CHLO|mmetsp:Transcript_15953/g.28646  ORF Transcript_15953/g.28646 Transcript_15953/m.28646 type:complete len:701 (+) Transcript_15953:206-2308(+)
MKFDTLLFLAIVTYAQVVILVEGIRFSKQLSSSLSIRGIYPSFFGFKNDLSDPQWREFRSSLPLLTGAMATFVLLSKWVTQSYGFLGRRRYQVAVGMIFIGVLHGAHSLIVLLLALGGYHLARFAASASTLTRTPIRAAGSTHEHKCNRFRYFFRWPRSVWLVWLLDCGFVLWARSLQGTPFTRLSPSLGFLDQHAGLLRWHVGVNFLLLRVLSYSLDIQRVTCRVETEVGGGEDRSDPATGGKLNRQDLNAVSDDTVTSDNGISSNNNGISHSMNSNNGANHVHMTTECDVANADDISLMAYLSYVLYPPLYIAGPITCFSDFLTSQKKSESSLSPPSSTHTPSPAAAATLLPYLLRLLLQLALLEVTTHLLHFNAVCRWRLLPYLEAHSTTSLAPLQPRPIDYAAAAYWVVVFMWLKFSVMWRFFRFFSLCDGTNCPENLPRCVMHNYDVEGFWRHWHVSFNRWLVRYLYIPLGGRNHKILLAWIVFLFVALWHEIEIQLVGWAVITVLAFTPELAVKKWVGSWLRRRRLDKKEKEKEKEKESWSWRKERGLRYLFGIGGTINAVLLFAANMVGFVAGVDGIGAFVEKILHQSPWFTVKVLVVLFSAIQLLFSIEDLQMGLSSEAVDQEGEGRGAGEEKRSAEKGSAEEGRGEREGEGKGESGEGKEPCNIEAKEKEKRRRSEENNRKGEKDDEGKTK